MGKPELQLRFLQGGCLLFLVICILLLHFGALGSLEPAGRELKFRQLLMLVGAIWSAVVELTFQRKVTRTATRPRRAGCEVHAVHPMEGWTCHASSECDLSRKLGPCVVLLSWAFVGRRYRLGGCPLFFW